MGHGTHHRDRSRTGASTAGHGRRLCGSRQPSAVHRRFRRQSRLGWGRVRTSGAERDRAPGVRSLRLAEAVHLRVSEPGAVQPSAGGGNPPQPGGDLAASQERLERYLQQMDEMDAADMADASPSKGRGNNEKIYVLFSGHIKDTLILDYRSLTRWQTTPAGPPLHPDRSGEPDRCGTKPQLHHPGQVSTTDDRLDRSTKLLTALGSSSGSQALRQRD